MIHRYVFLSLLRSCVEMLACQDMRSRVGVNVKHLDGENRVHTNPSMPAQLGKYIREDESNC